MSESEKCQYQRLCESGPAHGALPPVCYPAAAKDFTRQPLGQESGEDPGETDTGRSQVWIDNFNYTWSFQYQCYVVLMDS